MRVTDIFTNVLTTTVVTDAACLSDANVSCLPVEEV